MKLKSLFYKNLSRRKLFSYLTALILFAVFSFFELIDKSKFTNEDTYCRIGMSHKPDERINHWINKYKRDQHTVIKCEIIGAYETKKKAQHAETKNIKAQGCEGSPGGRGPEKAKWFVYKLTIFKGPSDDAKTFCNPKKLNTNRSNRFLN